MNATDTVEKLRDTADEALRHWHLEGAALDLLKHRENAVFKVTAGDVRYALRLHRHGYHSDDALRSELQWMEALAEAGIDVPRIVPTASGAAFAHQRVAGAGPELQVDLFEWIEGRQLGSVEAGISAGSRGVHDLYHALGVLAATLHDQAEHWRPSPSFVRHAWDERGLAGERPLWGRFLELPHLSPAQGKLLADAQARAYRDLAALPKRADEYSMIHADVTPENVLVHEGRLRLIDFDDAGYGWHLFELVTPLFFLMDEPYFEEARDALIAGYRERRALNEEQLARLPLFFLARAFTYLGWVSTRPETETARDLTPMLVEVTCKLAEDYVRGP